MTVKRYDLNNCIGCRNCVTVCPCDVMRFDEEANKSVIAYPENCQSCGQCYMNCMGRSLVISLEMINYMTGNFRAASTVSWAQADEATVKTITEAAAATDSSGSGSGSWGK
mgnify:CR=1 FL=1